MKVKKHSRCKMDYLQSRKYPFVFVGVYPEVSNIEKLKKDRSDSLNNLTDLLVKLTSNEV